MKVVLKPAGDDIATYFAAVDDRVVGPVGGGPDFAGYGYLTGLVRSTLPMIERYGVGTTADIDIDTLEERLRSDTVDLDATVAFPAIVSAWSRRTTATEYAGDTNRPASAHRLRRRS